MKEIPSALRDQRAGAGPPYRRPLGDPSLFILAEGYEGYPAGYGGVAAEGSLRRRFGPHREEAMEPHSATTRWSDRRMGRGE